MKPNKYYKSLDFDSPDLAGSGDNMQNELIEKLILAIIIYGKVPHINSGYRTKEYNKKVNGADNSAHLRGYAVDLSVMNGRDRFVLLNSLIAVGFTRIGVGKTFIHVDCDPSLPEKVLWTY